MDVSEKDDFLGRWLNGTLSHEEKEAFERSEEFAVYQKIAEESSKFNVAEYDRESHLEKIKQKVQRSSHSIIRRLAPVFATAAAVLIFLTFYFMADNQHVLTTSFGQISEKVMPDNTRVTLNANSRIAYQTKDWEEERLIRLEGEAFFDVNKGAPFIVETDLGQIEVLGTQFNVYTRDDLFEVICYEGKVRVKGSEDEVYLTVGQSYREVSGEVENLGNIESASPTWLNGDISFENAPINHVLMALSDHYELIFEGDLPPDTVRITVSFPADNEQLALDLVFKSLQKTYKRSMYKVIQIE